MKLPSQHRRRPKAYLSAYTMNHIHPRNPWVVAFFSFSYPGFGNFMQHRYIVAFILILWELLINHLAKLNLGIMYTLQGRFDQAKAVLDSRWLMLYVGLYIFAIWDSYRSTFVLNKLNILANRTNSFIPTVSMNSWETNYLDKRNPRMALLWSMLAPGAGHLYVHKVIAGIFILSYTTIVLYFSHIPQAIQFTLIGDFIRVKQIVDMQWLLHLPSIYWFFCYDAYVTAVEQNKLFEREQSVLLKRNYQSADFEMPV